MLRRKQYSVLLAGLLPQTTQCGTPTQVMTVHTQQAPTVCLPAIISSGNPSAVGTVVRPNILSSGGRSKDVYTLCYRCVGWMTEVLRAKVLRTEEQKNIKSKRAAKQKNRVTNMLEILSLWNIRKLCRCLLSVLSVNCMLCCSPHWFTLAGVRAGERRCGRRWKMP